MEYENHTQCPCCKQQTIPPIYKNEKDIVKAVRCQNRSCGVIFKIKKESKKR